MDKRVTRAANSGATRYIMFGKVWALSPGVWSVKMDRTTHYGRIIPGRGRLVQVEKYPDWKPETL